MRKFIYFIFTLFMCTTLFCSCGKSYLGEIIGRYRCSEKIYHTNNWNDDIMEGYVIGVEGENLIFSCSDDDSDKKPATLEKFKLSKDNFDIMFSDSDFFEGKWEGGHKSESIRKNNRASFKAVLDEYNTMAYVLLQKDGTVLYANMLGTYSNHVCIYIAVLERA